MWRHGPAILRRVQRWLVRGYEHPIDEHSIVAITEAEPSPDNPRNQFVAGFLGTPQMNLVPVLNEDNAGYRDRDQRGQGRGQRGPRRELLAPVHRASRDIEGRGPISVRAGCVRQLIAIRPDVGHLVHNQEKAALWGRLVFVNK